MCMCVCVRVRVCACVCVCVRELVGACVHLLAPDNEGNLSYPRRLDNLAHLIHSGLEHVLGRHVHLRHHEQGRALEGKSHA